MAEERASGGASGWVKAIVTSVMGLCSGAVLMYVSPLVNSAIKPGKPVANFSHNADGLTVTFQNRAMGGSDGWWDFGDGSPLEPFSASQETLTHTFARPVTYNVKLSLHNYLGEESERSVAVDLSLSAQGPPIIEAFKVDPMKRHATAPATFKLASHIKNADLCILYVGDDRPMEVTTDTSSMERYITLKDPGRYTLRVVAVSGKNTAEKTESVVVGEASASAPSASLQVTYQAVHVQRTLKEVTFHVAFPADRKETSHPFKLPHLESGEQIAEAKFTSAVKEASVKNPALTISPDKTKVVLTGELVKPGGVLAFQKNPPPIKWTPTVLLTLERRSEPALKATDPISLELNVPGVTLLSLPKLPHWEIKGTMLHLELLDGAKVTFKDSKFPTTGKLVQFKNHPYRLTATQETDHIRVELVDAQATLRPIGN